MAHPKRRTSVQRRDKRRSHDFMVAPHLTTCSHCGSAILTHRVCPECGYYRGKQAIEI
ncbi:MAG TPA: 50S ribosomal protein L32 [Bacteroidales bacterium]|jgi:large subunit ribosomal protein L32|nr:50S ribosomal protein L32 [Bacteroidales bacterium]HOH22632.1 50S ribosomal protein L32 [Bacteroidales bacterium]HPZ03777.1 50S ribosomal protein L32 [Bacteroidales bacterium]HQB75331.1 50S ribosomal protein L32 [Bacteroidales bacterium]HQQ20347.1 50S ribosomal protein L32 [Bacteroidales bacterium]